ncbi:MAG: ORF6N domain-containing protein [Kiritimatiellaeota bacterium]|nr:ORF6N domain-containing protein [Kiritimatiellota bacterium]
MNPITPKQTDALAVQGQIYILRGKQVMLDFDLAKLYGVKTMRLNEAVKRNIKRFPDDFMFQLTKQEAENLISQFAISSWGGTRKLPYAFTEQGVAMLSGLLNSETAIEVNIAIMRAFVLMRQYALSHKDLTEKLQELERKYDQKFHTVHQALDYLLQKDRQDAAQPKRKQIGFRP